MRFSIPRAQALGIALAAWMAGCTFEEQHALEPPGAHAEAPAVSGHGEPAVSPGTPAAPDTADRREPGALASVAAAPVIGWSGPGGKPFEVELRTADPSTANVRRFGTITLRNSARERSPDLGQYPCASCHIGRQVVMRDERIADAHRNITPQHPAQTGATCATCHASENVEWLALKNGERATLDHTYRLCAQCHFSQAESWAGGAHGKRLDGWQGRRVVMGCADCHDPHNPRIGTRVPFRAPSLTRPSVQRP